MNQHAIAHTTQVPYAYPRDEASLALRVRTAAGHILMVRVFYKARYHRGFYHIRTLERVHCGADFDHFETVIALPRNRYRYFFELMDQEGTVRCLDERGLRRRKLQGTEATAFQYAYIGPSDVYTPVPWWCTRSSPTAFTGRGSGRRSTALGTPRWIAGASLAGT